MALPKAEIPKYELTLPASKKKIQFRPFVVKEEKILLLALQDGNPEQIITAMAQIIENCTFGACKLDDLSQIDVEFLFLHIRNRSMGEGVEVTAKCTSCEKDTSLLLDLSAVKVEEGKKVAPEIQLSNNMWVVMKYPSIRTTYQMAIENSNDSIFKVLAASIDQIIDGEQTYSTSDSPLSEVLEFIDGLTQQQLDKMQAFFEGAPKVVYENDYKCSHCGAENHIKLEGLQNFFD